MGLFSNKKKLCPICGNPTPRLFPQKFDDQPICKECERKIDLPRGAVDNMKLDDFRQYLADFEENGALRSLFRKSYQFSPAFQTLQLDEKNGLIRFNDGSGWAIEKKYLKSFRIFEDNNVLFESSDGALKSYLSRVPADVEAVRPIIMAFDMEKRAYERKEEMNRLHNRNETEEERRERQRIADTYRPHFEETKLFDKFRIEITLDHPYWTAFEGEVNAPSFDRDYPSAERYMKEYREQADGLHLLAVKLMYMIDPNAGEIRIGFDEETAASNPAVVPLDTVAEIKKYKELLELGVITEEEFTAKKRQLLGI